MKQRYLKKILNYDQDTGVFTWLERLAYRLRVGDVAGTVNGAGYSQIRICGKVYGAHRLAWLYLYGEWPNKIDHINHNRADNRMCNQRDCGNHGNAKNRSLGKNNTSGHIGVQWDVDREKWRVRIGIEGKKISAGAFSKKEDAIVAAKIAYAEHGFHPMHGSA